MEKLRLGGLAIAMGVVVSACSGANGSQSSIPAQPGSLSSRPLSVGSTAAYRVVDLGFEISPTRINGKGEIAGNNENTLKPFIYDNGTFTTLGCVSNGNCTATDINNRGDVVGFASEYTASRGFLQQAVLFQGSATPTLLANPSTYQFAQANGINNHGIATGWVQTTLGSCPQAATFTDNGTATILPAVQGNADFYSTEAYAINDAGSIVATSILTQGNCSTGPLTPIEYHPQRTIPLSSSASANSGYPTDINERGDVVGYYQCSFGASCGSVSFYFHHGTTTVISAPPPSTSIFANAVDANGSVVGFFAAGSNASHAFIWKSGKVLDLNSLIGPNSGWVLNGASDIDARGDIIGVGTFKGQEQHGFLLIRQASCPLPL